MALILQQSTQKNWNDSNSKLLTNNPRNPTFENVEFDLEFLTLDIDILSVLILISHDYDKFLLHHLLLLRENVSSFVVLLNSCS